MQHAPVMGITSPGFVQCMPGVSACSNEGSGTFHSEGRKASTSEALHADGVGLGQGAVGSFCDARTPPWWCNLSILLFEVTSPAQRCQAVPLFA